MARAITTYYGKRYRQVYSTTSRKKANVVAHGLLLTLKEEMGAKEKILVMVNHGEKMHRIFVKCPWDKVVKKIR